MCLISLLMLFMLNTVGMCNILLENLKIVIDLYNCGQVQSKKKNLLCRVERTLTDPDVFKFIQTHLLAVSKSTPVDRGVRCL